MFENIKTIVFDLDGTIYQDVSFYREYIHFLLENTRYSDWEKYIIEFCDRVFDGQELTMNDYYMTGPKSFNNIDELLNEIRKSHCNKKEKGSINLGDAWAVMTLIGQTMNLYYDDRCNKIFAKTRASMIEHGLVSDRELYQAIKDLSKDYDVVLLSNSYESTVKDFLKEMNYEDAFSKIGYSSSKPDKMVEALNRVYPEALNEPETVLTIGDHAYNDLEPLANLGAKTVWINPYPNISKVKCDLELKSTVELSNFLKTLMK